MFRILILILQNRCVNIIAHLFNAPVGEKETAVGVGTVGSSEAIMLAGLAFKRKWQNKRKAEGKPYDKPNIVTGANVQVSFSLRQSCFLVYNWNLAIMSFIFHLKNDMLLLNSCELCVLFMLYMKGCCFSCHVFCYLQALVPYFSVLYSAYCKVYSCCIISSRCCISFKCHNSRIENKFNRCLIQEQRHTQVVHFLSKTFTVVRYICQDWKH